MGILKNRRLKREKKTEAEIYRLMDDREWWYVLDMIDEGHWGGGISEVLFGSLGYVYPVLARLEKQGVIESRWTPGDKVSHRRRQYRMTERKVARV